MMEHFIHRNGQGVFIAKHHHRERIAHENGVDACLVHCHGGGIVVGSQHGDRLAAFLLLAERESRHFFAL